MYSVWAKRRRAIVFTVAGLLLCAVVATVVASLTTEKPTCTDAKKNNNETGIDCGGVCTRVCSEETTPLRLRWVRAFPVSAGWWSAMAYIENANTDMIAENVPYRITLYDDAGFVVATTENKTTMFDEVVVPVYWGRIFLPEGRSVYRATFEWLSDPVWHRGAVAPSVHIEQQARTTRNGLPEVRALLVNDEYVPLTDIVVNVIVYDNQQNAIAVSQTIVSRLEAQARIPLSFVWQEEFTSEAFRIEIAPRVPPQK